jgi:nucleoside phosphorylase
MNPKRTYGDEEPSVSLPKRLRTFDTAFNGGIYLNRDAYSPLVHGDYTIAWICALPLELAASRAMLDEEHPLPPNQAGDDNIYVLGRIDQHNVVMTCLPGQYGTNNAAIVATNLKRSFPSIRATLMVGIGGGSPTQADLYLGDVVVGTRVIQYDMGKMTAGGLFQGTADAKTSCAATELGCVCVTVETSAAPFQQSGRKHPAKPTPAHPTPEPPRSPFPGVL